MRLRIIINNNNKHNTNHNNNDRNHNDRNNNDNDNKNNDSNYYNTNNNLIRFFIVVLDQYLKAYTHTYNIY